MNLPKVNFTQLEASLIRLGAQYDAFSAECERQGIPLEQEREMIAKMTKEFIAELYTEGSVGQAFLALTYLTDEMEALLDGTRKLAQRNQL